MATIPITTCCCYCHPITAIWLIYYRDLPLPITHAYILQKMTWKTDNAGVNVKPYIPPPQGYMWGLWNLGFFPWCTCRPNLFLENYSITKLKVTVGEVELPLRVCRGGSRNFGWRGGGDIICNTYNLSATPFLQISLSAGQSLGGGG